MSHCWKRIEDGDWIRLVFDLPDEKVNVLRRDNMEELRDHLEEIAGSSASGLTIESGKEAGFIAGADINAIADVTDPAEGQKAAQLGQSIFAALEGLPMPTVALVHGACVGGGLELALACDLRIASSDPSTQLGLPEVMLGILPGFGGTQRLPRLLGLVPALPLLLTGKLLSAKAAQRIGLVDAVVARGALPAAAQRLARSRGSLRLPRRGRLLERLVRALPPLRGFILNRARASVKRKTGGCYPAPPAIVDAVEAGYGGPRAAGFETEARLLGGLIVSPVSKHLVRLFRLSEAARDVPTEGLPQIRRATVAGAGTMGAGIATLFASSGVRTRWTDARPEALAAGMRKASEVLTRKVRRRGGGRAQIQAAIDSLEPIVQLEGLGGQDLFLEAIIEDMGIKKELLARVDAELPVRAIIATNTSSLDLDDMATALGDPGRLVGIHFYTPVHRMRLVEIVRGGQTRPEVIDTARAFVRRLGKVPVVVGNAPGFLVNRLLTPYLLEAEKLVAEGFAVRDIDRCMRSAGMPMGPLELIDEIGLDVASLVARTMQDAFGDRFPSAGVVEELRAKGCLGKKSGCGFYDYSGKKRTVHPDVARKARLPLYAERVRLRLVLPVVLEGLRCLDEGVIAHEDAIDLAMQLGTGFLLPEGGPMTWARAQGWQHLMRQCEALEIETPPGLQQRARSLQEANP